MRRIRGRHQPAGGRVPVLVALPHSTQQAAPAQTRRRAPRMGGCLMGASNVIAAYTAWAGKVPATSMQLLAYMAAVSLDSDPEPWFGMGHEALAIHALGYREPTDAALRAVRRAIAPLRQAGAISVSRRSAPRRGGASTVRYRLHLDGSATAAESIDERAVDNPPVGAVDNHDVGRKASYEHRTETVLRPPQRRTKSVQDVGRKPSYRGVRRRTTTEEREGGLPTPSPTATHPPDDAHTAPTEEIDSDKDVCAECGVLLDPDQVCRNRGCGRYELAAVIPLRRKEAAA